VENPDDIAAPQPHDVAALRRRLADYLVATPVLRCAALEDDLPAGTEVHAKLEFLQRTGTFKARGALSVMLGLSAEQRAAGVTAVSAGNHAIAVAYAAQVAGTKARVVMTRAANPARIQRCEAFGAEIVLAEDVHRAFAEAERIRREDGCYFVHPFDAPEIALGTATLGAEICEQIDPLDALIVPVGGGGLCAGVASIVRQLAPACRIIGVEPVGANSMSRSFAAGTPQTLEAVDTIADSLGAPFALPYSFELCRRNVDELVQVSDEELSSAMRVLFRRLKMAVEPACAASTAALLGPLAERLAGARVGLLMCGSNMDWATYAQHAKLP